MQVTPDQLARELFEVVPLVMSTIRAEVRRHREGGLSLAEYRVLVYLRGRQDVSLSALAEHIGLGLPSMSKMVEGLVERKLMKRQTPADDRRRVTLELTARGNALWQSARESTQAALAERFALLSEQERATVIQAMQILQPLFRRVAIRRQNGNSGD